MGITVLDRRLYSFSQVDELLELPAGTARRWVDGYTRDGRIYPPVIRQEPQGEPVAWGELVEAGLLAKYRQANVPLQRMRPVIQLLRDRLGLPYPLAHTRPFVAERELVMDIQHLVGLDEALRIVVAPRTGQLVLAPSAEEFYRQVDWNEVENTATSIRLDGPIVLDPERGFGEPTINGIRTEILAEQVGAGDDPAWVASIYGLEVDDVAAAVVFQRRRAA